MEKDKNPNKSLRSLNESFSRIVNGEPQKNKEEKLSEQWPFQMPWDKPYSTPEDAPGYIEPYSLPDGISPAPPPFDGMEAIDPADQTTHIQDYLALLNRLDILRLQADSNKAVDNNKHHKVTSVYK